MPEENKTRYAILGVLNLKPGSGYDIKKFCDKTLSHYWKENFGNIYPMLAKLEQECLIERLPGETDRKKTLYHITEAGLLDLRRWLEQPVKYQPARSELLLKLSFASLMPPEGVLTMLQEVKRKHMDDLRQYRVLEAAYTADENAKKHPQYFFWLAPMRYGIESAAMTIRWCDETMASIRSHSKET